MAFQKLVQRGKVTGLPNFREGRGCDVYRFDFASRRERRVSRASSAHGSEVLPSVWRDRLAFVRFPSVKGGGSYIPRRSYVPQIVVTTLTGRAVTSKIFSGDRRRVRASESSVGGVGLDLYGSRLAYVWDWAEDECPAALRRSPDGERGVSVRSELWLSSVTGAQRRLATGCNEGATKRITGPTFSSGRLFYARTGDASIPGSSRLAAYRLASGHTRLASLTDCVGSLAVSRAELFGETANCSTGGAPFSITRSPLPGEAPFETK